MEQQALLEKILLHNSLSRTATRRKVLDLFIDQEPQTIAELQKRAQGAVDRASLYRTIELFEKLAILHRIHIGWKYKLELTDIFQHHHHHISCTGCGQIVAIAEDKRIEAFIAELTKKYQITAATHQLEIQGICAKCAKSELS
jgi:Fur family ferric uptake transcriptional regulator